MAREKILIADDSSHVRMLVRQALAGDGYELLEAMDGAEALRMAIEERPDLILLDLNMPELDGFEVIRLMEQRPETAETKVMMLTSSGDLSHVRSSYELGAVGYIMKPVNSGDLNNAVARALAPSAG